LFHTIRARLDPEAVFVEPFVLEPSVKAKFKRIRCAVDIFHRKGELRAIHRIPDEKGSRDGSASAALCREMPCEHCVVHKALVESDFTAHDVKFFRPHAEELRRIVPVVEHIAVTGIARVIPFMGISRIMPAAASGCCSDIRTAVDTEVEMRSPATIFRARSGATDRFAFVHGVSYAHEDIVSRRIIRIRTEVAINRHHGPVFGFVLDEDAASVVAALGLVCDFDHGSVADRKDFRSVRRLGRARRRHHIVAEVVAVQGAVPEAVRHGVVARDRKRPAEGEVGEKEHEHTHNVFRQFFHGFSFADFFHALRFPG
jgi:hypothetical protein